MSFDHPSRMGHPRESSSAPSAPPIYQSTAFDVRDLDVLQGIHSGTIHGDIYTRDSNPNHSALAESIAVLEGVAAGAVFASGMGALGKEAFKVAGTENKSVICKLTGWKPVLRPEDARNLPSDPHDFGSRRIINAPRSDDPTDASPPCACMMRRTIAMPRPVPLDFVV